MARVEVEIEVLCTSCGIRLDGIGRGDEIEVDPCERCLEEARKRGYGEGDADGYDRARDET